MKRLSGIKLKKRREKNAESAKKSREKRIAGLKELKDKVTSLEAQNTILLLELAHAIELRSACTCTCVLVK